MATVVAPAGTIHKGCHHKHPHSVLGVCRTMEAEVCSKVCVCCTCSSEHIYSGSPGRAGTKLTPIFVVNVVTHLLDLAVLCCWFWLHRWSEMCKIESEFSKCSHFLNTILMNSVKRGSFPHCKFCTTPHSVTFQYTFVPCSWYKPIQFICTYIHIHIICTCTYVHTYTGLYMRCNCSMYVHLCGLSFSIADALTGFHNHTYISVYLTVAFTILHL